MSFALAVSRRLFPLSSRRLLAVLACALLSACSQSEGDACQVDSDCDDGLVCRISSGLRGMCEPPEADSGQNDDEEVMDASFDDDAGFDMEGPMSPDDDDAG